MTIGIVGAGAFGTGLALALSGEAEVILWGREPDTMKAMANSRKTSLRLSGFELPKTVKPTSALTDLHAAQVVLLCLPTQKLASALPMFKTHVQNAPLVACCKGMDVKSGLGPTGIIENDSPAANSAVLTGPSFAADLAKGLPTALTLATSDEALGSALQTQLSRPNLRLYRSSDVIGAELGGALKNVIAIACGAALGAGLGQSAQAALMTRGFVEMCRVAVHLGAEQQTLMGLSGFGDLVLTCTSAQSRNFRYGFSLGQGSSFDEDTTVEGRSTVLAVTKMGLDLPICAAVADLVSGRVEVQAAIQSLLTRPLKEE